LEKICRSDDATENNFTTVGCGDAYCTELIQDGVFLQTFVVKVMETSG